MGGGLKGYIPLYKKNNILAFIPPITVSFNHH